MAIGENDPGSTIPQPAGLGFGTPRPDSKAFGSGISGGSGWGSVSLSIAQQDLSGERMLRDATRVAFEDRQVPSLGGIVLLAKLGQGGMGAVYYGVHPRLRTEVAVKVLPFQLADRNPELVNRFIREAQIAAQIKSPHLVGVTDVNEENGLFYLVMEFVRGTSAGSYLKKIKAGGGAGLSEADALDICIAGVAGLAAAHLKGIVHRDIKPDNVMIPLASDGTLELKESKLADLGLARGEESGASLTGTQAVMGTPGYMAPEQGMDARKAGKPADVFSVGAMLYALLCGNAPFRDGPALAVIFKAINEPHEPIASYRPDVSPGTAALIDRCLAKHPQERYPDATALLEALKVCRQALGSIGSAQQVVEQLTLISQAREAGLPVASGTPVPAGTSHSSSPSALSISAVSAAASAAPSGPMASSSTVLPAGVGPASTPPSVAPQPVQGGIPWVVLGVAALFATVVAGIAFVSLRKQDKGPPVLSKRESPAPTLEKSAEPADAKTPTIEAQPNQAAAQALTVALTLASKAQEKENWEEVILALEAPLNHPGTKNHPNRPLAEKYLENAKSNLARIGAFNTKIAEADRLLEAKNFTEAQAAYEAAGKLWPDGSNAEKVKEGLEAARNGESDKRYNSEMAKGADAEKKSDWTTAEKAYVAVLAMRANDPKASELLARVKAAALQDLRDQAQKAITEKRWDDAERFLNLILLKAPDDKQVREELPNLRDRKAAAELQALRNAAMALAKDAHWKEARDKWNEVLAIKKDDAAALKGLDELKAIENDTLYKKAVAEGETAFKANKFKEAADLLSKALEYKMDDPKAMEILAACKSRTLEADYAQAIRDGETAEEKGDYDDAIRFYRQALTLKQQEKTALTNIQRANGLKEKTAFDALIKKARGFEGNDWGAAEAAYKEAAKLKPDAEDVKTGLNTVHSARNARAYDKALIDARKVLDGEPTGEGGRYTQLSSEKRKQVEALLAHALELRPNDGAVTKLRSLLGQPSGLSVALGQGLKMEFALVPSGQFQMGAEDGDKSEKPVHRVTISKPYYVARFPVTVEQFAVFHAEKGYKTEAENNLGRDGGDKGYSAGDTTAWNQPGYLKMDQAPVTLLTWKEANDYAEWLSAKSGRKVRLPTEAEWEYAARAGTQKRYSGGDGEVDLDRVGWFASNSKKMAQPVGQKAANAYGLHDMLGNVNEWCSDTFEPGYYGASPAQDPQGPEKSGNKIFRGGSWKDKPEACRVSSRASASRLIYRNDLGFRLVVESE